MPPSNLIGVFREFPRELFRVNNGPLIKLRVWSPQRHSYDIFTERGLVVPKALDASGYAGQYSQCRQDRVFQYLKG
jgi:hypothetical protein